MTRQTRSQPSGCMLLLVLFVALTSIGLGVVIFHFVSKVW